MPAPRGLRVKSAGPAGVTLAWKAARGAKPAAYLVFRDGRRIARTARRSYTDTRAMPGRHRYVVAAVDARGMRTVNTLPHPSPGLCASTLP